VNVARVDPALSIQLLSARALQYSDRVADAEDRPAHVRAASGLAFTGGRLAVIQDDCAFIGMIGGDEVAALTLPRGAGGRRRFEVELGNKHEKYDLESCIAIGDDLFAFGSGSTPAREKVVHVGYGTHVIDAAPLFARLRVEVGGPVNIEGAALVGAAGPRRRALPLAQTPSEAALSGAMQMWPQEPEDSTNELWLFHRGNTSAADVPAIIKLGRTPVFRWLLGNGPVPEPLGSSRFDLGRADGSRYGFTDAIAVGDKVFFLAAAEASPNAVDDGAVAGSMLGVIARETGDVRMAPLVIDGAPVKAEGLAFDPGDPSESGHLHLGPSDPLCAWVAVDPDDVNQAAMLYQLRLVGPW
jgi:hypothetical protein